MHTLRYTEKTLVYPNICHYGMDHTQFGKPEGESLPSDEPKYELAMDEGTVDGDHSVIQVFRITKDRKAEIIHPDDPDYPKNLKP